MSTVLEIFRELSSIPRPSFHEEKIAAYLEDKGREMGCNVIRDKKNNIIYEKVPLNKNEIDQNSFIILQAHMDMVCYSEKEGYRPQYDPIELIRQGNELRANGTTLGADNGIGIAVILKLFQEVDVRRPLRAIFTVEEEDGMGGAKKLDSKYLRGRYFIGLDWISFRSTCLEAAASILFHIQKQLEWEEPAEKRSVRLYLRGLPGGHSGLDICRVKSNAIQEMAGVLQNLQLQGIDFQLADFKGGSAANLIPSDCECIIVLSDYMYLKLQQVIPEICQEILREPPENDGRPEIGFRDDVMQKKVLQKRCMKEFLDFLQTIPNGVLKEQEGFPECPELSSNIGMIRTDYEGGEIRIMARARNEKLLKNYYLQIQEIAFRYHAQVEDVRQAPGFICKEGGELIEKIRYLYRKQTGRELAREKIHAGVECGYFQTKQNQIEMVLLGAELKGIHTTKEALEIDSADKLYQLLAALLHSL